MRIHGLAPDDDTPLFVISVAAELAGMHAQTLRQYDRLGLVTPSRTRGVSLAGIQRILELENEVSALRARLLDLTDQLERVNMASGFGARFFAVGSAGEAVALRRGERPRHTRSQALVVWRPNR